MDRNPTALTDGSPLPDDAELGTLVRAVAEDWHRPPQRLDQPTWRERVDRGRTGRRSSGGRRWIGKVAQAGVLAVVATLVLAVSAIFLVGNGRDGGVGNVPSTNPTEGATGSPTTRPSGSTKPPTMSPLPALFVDGDLPSVTRVLLQGSGGYRYADLTTGTLEADLPIFGGNSGSLLARPDGGWVCICVVTSVGTPFGQRITLTAVDNAGAPAGTVDVRTLSSDLTDLAPEHMLVDVRVSPSADGRVAFIGWTRQMVSGWDTGVDVVDLTTLSIVDTLELAGPTRSAAVEGREWARLAPTVSQLSGGGGVLISSDWYVYDVTTAAPPAGTDHWSAAFDGTTLSAASDAGTRDGTGCGEWERGLIDASSYYTACIDQSGDVHVARFRLDGSPIDVVDVGRWTGFGVNSTRAGNKLFLWDPQTQTLVRYDLSTGTSDQVSAPGTASVDGPLEAVSALGRAVGEWLVPSAAAKIWLQPAIAISQDGERLYALGVDGSVETLGSKGVFSFDIGGPTMSFLDRWEPTADLISIAISADGAFVYAAGMGGVDATGLANTGFKPSVTVFDATNGSTRLIAGQLAGNELLFVDPIVR